MEIYLDNSATTKVFPSVQKVMVQMMEENYGNPSAMHKKGVEAEQYIREAREKIAKQLKVHDKEIIFTSGGTESNNMAIIGAAMANRRLGNHIITSVIEHPSVLNVMKYLEEQGFEVTYLPVDNVGRINLQDLETAISDNTILISIMYVNNEIGAVEPIEEISKIIKKKNPSAVFHVDAIQAFGKYLIKPKKQGIDLLSVSAHKIHGPKGVGFLYVNEKIKIKPIMFGGGQQNNFRSGTENVPGIVGLGEATVCIYEDFADYVKKLYALKDRFIKGIEKIEGTHINGLVGEESAPQIVSVSFLDVRSEVLLHALEEREIYVSAGSACAAHKSKTSVTLSSIRLKKEYLESTIRFSFGYYTTERDIDETLKALEKILPELRKYRRI